MRKSPKRPKRKRATLVRLFDEERELMDMFRGRVALATFMRDLSLNVCRMARDQIEEIDADKDTILGAWTGHEWRYMEENSLGRTKENLAIGKMADGKKGLLVYRLQEVSSTGRRLYDKSLVIRFTLPVK